MGYNFRLTDLQAAVGLVQLAKLDRIVSRKLELLKAYREALADVPEITIFEPNPAPTGFRSASASSPRVPPNSWNI